LREKLYFKTSSQFVRTAELLVLDRTICVSTIGSPEELITSSMTMPKKKWSIVYGKNK